MTTTPHENQTSYYGHVPAGSDGGNAVTAYAGGFTAGVGVGGWND